MVTGEVIIIHVLKQCIQTQLLIHIGKETELFPDGIIDLLIFFQHSSKLEWCGDHLCFQQNPCYFVHNLSHCQ